MELENKYSELKNLIYLRINDNYNNEYNERLEYELTTFKKCGLGMIEYLLALIKIINYSNDNNIYIKSFGYTSSSLVMYVLGINDIDPIKYDLPFERFLNIDKKKIIQVDLYLDISKVKCITDYIKNNFLYNDILRFKFRIIPSNLITKLCNYKIDMISNLNLDDKEIIVNSNLNILSRREMKIIKNLKPKCFNELYVINSISYEEYKELKSNRKVINNNIINNILKDTKGIILYEEQLMIILNRIIGYSLNEADNFRLFLKKNYNNKRVLLKEKDNFMNIAIKNNCNNALAEKIYNLIVESSKRYLLSKSLDLSIMNIKYKIMYLNNMKGSNAND